MRIDPKVAIQPTAREPREAQPSAVKTGEAAASNASVVKLSTAGVAASSAPSAATTTTRLQTIRAMLDKGAYPVNLDLLASRIVDDEVLRAGRS
jgi:anti-sigma28 factor (negative regulator of flagellin synthesis)